MSSVKASPGAGATALLLIVDDDAGQRGLLESFLRGQGFTTLTAASAEQALDILRRDPVSLMISDVRMPGLSGLDALRQLRQARNRLPVLLVTAFPDVRDAVGAMKDGAVDYLEKPIDLDELLATVRRALGLDAREPVREDADRALPPGVIAHSPLMRAVFREAALVAPSDSRVLLTGESGVGKEVVADVIHAWSRRAAGPFVKVNCAALPENLLESELFGHEKGAFTGAIAQRLGRFEEADQGAILLDEISEMSPALQAKLLRVIQDGVFQRVGSNQDRRTGARLLTATNQDLERAVAQGTFREDLFYRLNVIEIHVPPLRERRADILPLAAHFLARFSERRPRFSPAVGHCLDQYPWPGNVRELRNAMERAALLCHGDLILPEHLPARLGTTLPAPSAPPAASSPSVSLQEIERQAILEALRENGYNRTETARALGISRRALVYKLRYYRELGYPVDAPASKPEPNDNGR